MRGITLPHSNKNLGSNLYNFQDNLTLRQRTTQESGGSRFYFQPKETARY